MLGFAESPNQQVMINDDVERVRIPLSPPSFQLTGTGKGCRGGSQSSVVRVRTFRAGLEKVAPIFDPRQSLWRGLEGNPHFLQQFSIFQRQAVFKRRIFGVAPVADPDARGFPRFVKISLVCVFPRKIHPLPELFFAPGVLHR